MDSQNLIYLSYDAAANHREHTTRRNTDLNQTDAEVPTNLEQIICGQGEGNEQLPPPGPVLHDPPPQELSSAEAATYFDGARWYEKHGSVDSSSDKSD